MKGVFMNFKEEAEQLSPYIRDMRRYFHQHGELSFREKETTARIAEELAPLGYEITTFPDYYGLIAVLKGSAEGKTVLLRADIDALPIREETGAPFASETEGIMHACGHDCHTAMLLGAAKLLAAHREEIPGTVMLLFQAAEESGHGMQYYLDHHCLDAADAAFGFHMSPDIPKGTISIDDGPLMASCTDFRCIVRGAAAHGSTPHLGHDAIVAASSILLNIQTIVSRLNNPLSPLVVTVGMVRGGKQFNIICDEVTMEGTIRSYDREMSRRAPELFREIAETTAKALGCQAEFIPVSFEPVTANEHPALTETARRAAVSLFGESILRSNPRSMGSEDFSLLMEKVPSVFARVGVRDEAAGMTWPLHSKNFCPDDSILWHGAALHAQFALDFLSGKGKQ